MLEKTFGHTTSSRTSIVFAEFVGFYVLIVNLYINVISLKNPPSSIVDKQKWLEMQKGKNSL